MGKPKQLEIIYQNGVPKIYLSGKILKIASKKNNKSYKKQSAKKEVWKEKLNREFPKEGFYGEKFGTGLKKEPGILKNANQRKELSDRIKTKLGWRNSHEYYF